MVRSEDHSAREMHVALLTTVHKNCEVTGAGLARGFNTYKFRRERNHTYQLKARDTAHASIIYCLLRCTSEVGDASLIQKSLSHCIVAIALFYDERTVGRFPSHSGSVVVMFLHPKQFTANHFLKITLIFMFRAMTFTTVIRLTFDAV